MKRSVTAGLAVLAGCFCLACATEERPPPEPGESSAGRALPAVWEWADAQLAWREWGPALLAEALENDRPLLLYLAAPGCEGLFAEGGAALRLLVEERFLSARVDPFARPDLARRFDFGGWPALVVLEPGGQVFAAAVDIPPERVERFLLRLLDAFAQGREAVAEKARRTEATEVAFALDPARVFAAVEAAFDTVHGGFGQGVKFPEPGTLAFLLDYHRLRGDGRALRLVGRSLEALLASPLRDGDGAVRAYSFTPDWRTPAPERDGLDQAGMLQVLLAAGPQYAAAAGGILAYIEGDLFDAERGVFRGRQVESERGGWWTDPALYADRHAALTRACALAGGARGLKMARAAADFALAHCLGEDGAVRHLCAGAGVAGLLEDQALVALALLEVEALGGEARYGRAARAALQYMEESLFDAQRGAFADRLAAPRLFPFRDGVVAAGNALAAELYLRQGHKARAAALLAGKRLEEAPGRAHAAAARAALRAEEAEQKNSL